jgi:hypothetical protein
VHHLVSHAVDFLGIGAHKAGTTWLWSMLRTHPRIWMPPLKELHYFDRLLRYFSANTLAADHLFERFLSRAPHNREFRRLCRAQLGQAFSMRNWPLFRWYLRYYLGGRDDKWYLSLFGEGHGRVRGEITPAYAMLEPDDVTRVHRLLPQAKIIFLLRNPIERAWSHIRFECMEGRFSGINDPAQIRQLIEHPGLTLRGDYLRTLDIWESKFPRAQIFTGFFDDIVAQPAQLLGKIYTFLEVEEDCRAILNANRQRKINASDPREMPDTVRQYLARKYLPDLERLSARFGGHAERWRAEATALISR